jgi:hypothetical protein
VPGGEVTNIERELRDVASKIHRMIGDVANMESKVQRHPRLAVILDKLKRDLKAWESDVKGWADSVVDDDDG